MSLKEAIEYGKFGWAVFPLLPRSKAPACPNGFHDAVKDRASIEALWGTRTNLNLGIATGDISGFWVLDIDPDKGGKESLDELENKYGSLPKTLFAKTGGGGNHYLFKMPKNTKLHCSIGKLGPGIDIRAIGGYIASPPSIHPNGTQYKWSNQEEIAETPSWLIKLILALKKDIPIKISENAQIIGDWTQDDILSMLEVISPDDRDVWIKIGMALNEGGWPVTIWDTWSRGSKKYKMGEPFRIWAGFKKGGGLSIGSLVHIAQENGWTPKEKPYEELDFSNVDGIDFRDFKNKINNIKLPEVKINIGGLVGDTLSWINSTAFKLQPELTIMNVLAALGAIFGRRYALQKLDTRTNIYMVGIAETGQGKDNSRKRIKQLMKLAELEQFIGPDEIRTGAGLRVELKKHPSIIANIDEIGMFMKAISDPKAPHYLQEISSIFTKIYSSSNASYDGGILASQPDEKNILYEPNLCIYGTTTIDSYASAMKSASIKTGELNRFIVLKSATDFPEPNFNLDASDPPEALISRWNAFKPEGMESAPDIVEQKKTIVLLGNLNKEIEELIKLQDKLHKENNSNGTGVLWVRYCENTLKIAMIIAIARDPINPILITSDLEFGKTLVGSSIRFMMKFASENMYDNEFQKRCSDFMEALNSGIENRTLMIRRLQIKARELDEIERALLEMDKITFNEQERPRRYIIK